MDNYRFIISGGGTGGHVFPAIAIGTALQKQYPNAQVLFVGAKGKMEMQKVPAAGFPIKGLWIAGLQRKFSFKLFLFPFKLMWSLLQAAYIVLSFKPTLVVGTGGYASGPLLRMAGLFGYPYVVQEQNSYAGITNSLLAKKAQKICVAYPGMESFFPADKIVLTGNPIRSDIIQQLPSKNSALSFFNLDRDKKTLLVLGGSQGAKRINEFIAENKAFFEVLQVQIIWQCGGLYFEQYKDLQDSNCSIHAFIEKMPMAFAAADIILSRSGASSVSELAVVAKPVIYIPSPNVAEDHQTKNAEAISKRGGALMVKESDLESQFKDVFSELIENSDKQMELSRASKLLSKPHATETIVEEIKKIIAK